MSSKSENDRLIDEILRQTSQKKAAAEEPAAPVQTAAAEEEPEVKEYHPRTVQEPAPEPDADLVEEKTTIQPAVKVTAAPAPMLDVPVEEASEKEPPKRKPKSSSSGKKHKKKRRRKHRSAKVYGVLIMLVLIFVISISLAVGIIQIGKDMLGLNGTETLVVFTIPEGATTQQIAEDLEAAGIIEIPEAFVYFSRLSKADASYVAGEHEVSSSMAYETLIDELTGVAVDDRVSVDVMFPEGISLYDAAEKLEENNVCEAEKFIYYFNAGGYGYAFEALLPTMTSNMKFCKMEGYFFPDTYTFYEEMEPDDVCRKIYMNFNAKMTEERLARMEELGLTLDELVTFASMVQAEAGNVDVMKDVASVFWNRLNTPNTFPKLQSDPTRVYVEEVIKPHIDLPDERIYNAYNTYECAGLPAGAIGNPGMDAIEAVLYPNDTPYFYFYANVKTGITYFSETLEEHNEKIAMVEQMNAEAENAEGGVE